MCPKKIIIFGLIIILIGCPVSINNFADAKKTESFPKINMLSIAPSYLQPGDLVCCEIWDFWTIIGGHDVNPGEEGYFDHIAIYMGKGRISAKGEFIPNKIFGIDYVIEATYLPFPRVRYTPLLLLQIYSKLYYAKVTDANESVRNGAIEFAQSRLGDKYQHFWYAEGISWHANSNPDDPNDINSNKWYCAELVWASYFNQGIDLDPTFPDDHNKDGIDDFDEDLGYLRFVSPRNIFYSDNVIRYDS